MHPRILPILDPDFCPPILSERTRQLTLQADTPCLRLGVEQGDGSIHSFDSSFSLKDLEAHPGAALHEIERLVKFLLWSRGGWRLHVAGPDWVSQALKTHFQETPTGKFDADLMGLMVFGKDFEVCAATRENLEPHASQEAPLGRHLEGCRIGFDLGASDRKVAAVLDGEVVFSEEKVWNPVPQKDPQWHFNEIMDSLKAAAAHLPRVDAIGGSSAGVIVNSEVRVASLFRGVPQDLFQSRVKGIFREIQRAWGDIPLEVVNDGEVTALAGSMAMGRNGVLGIAMGSSLAAGYVDQNGNITRWLNELAFAPVDHRPNAPKDEWSGDLGCGVQYFSQQGVARLIPASGLEVDRSQPLPEQLKAVQEAMARGDDRAAKLYSTIGVYLGYTLPHYARFYDFNSLLVLGRVMTGDGGQLILQHARAVMDSEFPEMSARLDFHQPGEKEKRHGQAIAAASLPALRA